MNKIENYRKVQGILLAILIANAFVSVFKIVIGNMIKSASMTADGYASMADGLSNVVGIIGIYFASKPEDDDHQYGHGKIEIITGLIIGIFLLGAGIKVIAEGIDRIQNPVTPEISSISIVIMLMTLIINIAVAYYEHTQGQKLNSSVLISDAMHTKSDIFVTIGVLITLIFIRLGMPPILDPIVSFIVALIIFHTAWEVLKDNINILIDVKVVDENEIDSIVRKNFDEVKEIHKIRSRGTANAIFIDMHVQVDLNMTVFECHKLMHNIEHKIQEELNPNAQVLIHIEPYKAKEYMQKLSQK